MFYGGSTGKNNLAENTTEKVYDDEKNPIILL